MTLIIIIISVVTKGLQRLTTLLSCSYPPLKASTFPIIFENFKFSAILGNFKLFDVWFKNMTVILPD